MRKRIGKSGQGGFTMIEVLLVVAILALISAIAIPVYGRILKRSRRTAFAAEATSLHEALKRFYIDHNKFPGAFSGTDMLDLTTLDPLTSGGYLSPRAAESFLGKQTGGKINLYISFWVSGQDQQFWMFLQPAYDPAETVYIFHTEFIFGSTWHDGVYFFDDGKYKKIDEMTEL